MTPPETFGRTFAAAKTPAARLALDPGGERRAGLATIDAAIDDQLIRGLAGERIIQLADRHDDETVLLPTLDEQTLATVTAHVDVETMEHRGAWALPERETVLAGWANFAWWVCQEPRFVASLADDDRHRITLRGNPAGTFAWAAVTPIFDLLCVPHDLRADKAGKPGKGDVAAQEKAWKPLDAMLEACEIDLAAELAPFRPGSGWSRLTSAQRAEARVRLVAGWAQHATPEVAARLRTWMLGGLVDRFYAKAKTGTPTSRDALTKAHWRPMVAFFGGDWLALLAYLEEQPHPNEQIAGSLPEPKLFVTGADRARQAAAAAGVDAGEVDRMLASFFGNQAATSLVEHRTAALRRVWAAVDKLHASQTPATGSLWGLLDERDEVHDTRFDDQYRKGLWRQALPADLNAEIVSLWGTVAMSKSVDRLVSRWLPHHGVWDTIGAALQFWHEMALTAFAHTETTGYWEWGLGEISDSQKPRLEALESAGCPVDRTFFSELAAAARALGPIEYRKDISTVGEGPITIEMTYTSSERKKRPGFERLRDVITRHRRAWAEEHLERWIEHRWQTDLRAAARAYNRHLLAKGKAPTPKQSITASQPALDRWFAGDVRALLTAIGQNAPAGAPVYERRLPADPYRFGKAVERALGGGLPEPDMVQWDSANRAKLAEFKRIREHNSARYYAAFAAYDYLRAWETLGEPPTEMKQVKGAKSHASMLDRGDSDAAWSKIAAAIQQVLADPAAAEVVQKPALPFARGAEPAETRAASHSPRDQAEGEPAPTGRGGLLRRMFGSRG